MLDVTLNAENVHDSTAFNGLYDRLCERLQEMKYVVADAGYKTPWIAKRVIDGNRIPVLPYKRQMGKNGFFRPKEFIYDEYFDYVLCSENTRDTDRNDYICLSFYSFLSNVVVL